MATTGELHAIIEELKLVDIGDAASYLGEESLVEDEASVAQWTASTNKVGDHTNCDWMLIKYTYSSIDRT